MKISDIKFYSMRVPLLTAFKTAVREVYEIENLILEIRTDSGQVGYGEAPPTAAVTGDTIESMIGVINTYYKKILIGRDILNLEDNLSLVDSSVVGNSSAKAALDMALYDYLVNYGICHYIGY